MDSTFIHVDEAVATAMTLLPNDTTLDKAIARQWAYMGLRDIGPGDHWFKDCILYPNSNLSFKKPDDMWKPIDIALYGNDNCEFKYSYKGLGRRIHESGNLFVDSGEYAPSVGSPIDLSEDQYYFHLGSNGAGVTYARIKYWRLPIDTDGLPLIPEQNNLTIALFIRWMWSVKQGSNQQDRQASRVDYLAARAESRSNNKMPNGIEFEQVAKEWTSLFSTTPQFKKF